MPTYEYICQKCDHEFELSQSIKDATLSVCPKEKCGLKKWGKGKLKKKITSGAGLIFKGSGFYITDYRSDSYKEAAKKDIESSRGSSSDAKSETKSDAKSTGKSESKAESKSETKAETKPAKAESKPAKSEKK